MRFWTKHPTRKALIVSAARLAHDEYVIDRLRRRSESDAAHFDATIARMAHDAAKPATGEGTGSRRG
jgi:hypothetical protein